MKSILFYWSKGADARRQIVVTLAKCETANKPCFPSELARKLKLSHVAILNHLTLLEKEGYTRTLNPGGKPAYIVLSEKGKEIAKEFTLR